MTTPNTTTDIVTKDYMRSPEIVKRFTNVLGSEALANSYIQSVLILVGSDKKLSECTPMSIQKSALRAASLGLSVDPATKQGWIISYRKNVGTKDRPQWINEAQFQPHYLGLYNLAMRTGKYWVINVQPVYEGQRVLENNLTGLHRIQQENGLVTMPVNPNADYSDVTTRRTKDMKIIGWIGYFKAKKGNEKSVYMSVAEIEDHAQKYVKNYRDEKTGKIENENWRDPDKRKTMEMKTVLRKLLSWADLSGSENAKLAEALQADTEASNPENVVDTTAEDIPQSAEMNIDEARRTIAKINGKDKALGNCSQDELNWVYINSLLPACVEAAKTILHDDYQADPPQAEKRTVEENKKQLGF